MKGLQRAMTLLFLLLCLTYSAGAAEDLASYMSEFREEYGLNEKNFSLCYRDVDSGEEYRFNDKAFLFAASTYKLPLNLYYYEQEREGTLSPSSLVDGLSLSRAHYQSLVWSDNDVSRAMIYNLGNFYTYKKKMRKYFTMKDKEIPASYYTDNYFCTAMMLDVLDYLYARREDFPEMLDYMSQAQPGEYFARYAGDIKVAHKYGLFYDEEEDIAAVNDVGIIYTDHPFLLAVYTQNAGNGAEVVARACERLIQYNEEVSREPVPLSEPAPEVPEPKPGPQPEPQANPTGETEAQKEPVPERETGEGVPAETETPEESPEEIARRNIWWMILVAAFIFLLADVGAFFWMRRGGLERLEEKWGDEDEDEEDEEESGV